MKPSASSRNEPRKRPNGEAACFLFLVSSVLIPLLFLVFSLGWAWDLARGSCILFLIPFVALPCARFAVAFILWSVLCFHPAELLLFLAFLCG